jgi:hypothetical protein
MIFPLALKKERYVEYWDLMVQERQQLLKAFAI